MTVTTPTTRRRGATVDPTWQLAALSFVSPGRRRFARRLFWYAPMVAVLTLQAALTLRLHNVAFSDEGLYINAGHEYLRQFAGGAKAPSYYGGYFSGYPMAYPVVAAALDTLGGLWLVRFVSLMLMLLATVSVGLIASHLAPPARRHVAQLSGMLMFVLSGPVLFVGNLATYDAVCMSLVITSAALAVVGQGRLTAGASGALLAIAGICKYSGAAFLPVVVMLAALAATDRWRALWRASLVAAYALLGLLLVYVPNASFITAGIELTTSSRVALNPRPLLFLLREAGSGIGVLLLLTAMGLAVMTLQARERGWDGWRPVALSATMVVSGLAIPLGQLHLHEYTSFNKHLTFAVMFCAPVAAQLINLRRGLPKMVLACAAFYVLSVFALYRSEFMFGEWPDTTPVIQAIQRADQPGTYLCRDAQSMAYYSQSHPELKWEEYWFLFGAGPKAIKQAVDEHKYEGISFVTGSSGNAELDANTEYLANLLSHDPDYHLVGSWPKHRYDANRFYLYLRTTSAKA